MPRHAGLMHAGLVDNITNLLLTEKENLHDAPPGWIGHHFPEVELLHACVYALSCIYSQALLTRIRQRDGISAPKNGRLLDADSVREWIRMAMDELPFRSDATVDQRDAQ